MKEMAFIPNKEQHAVIQNIKGPVLVLAPVSGPGNDGFGRTGPPSCCWGDRARTDPLPNLHQPGRGRDGLQGQKTLSLVEFDSFDNLRNKSLG